MKQATATAAALAALPTSAGRADGRRHAVPVRHLRDPVRRVGPPAGALPDLRGRAAVRQPRRPAVDDARGLRATHKNTHQAGRGAALLDQHRAEVRHRPAGVPDPDRRRATSCGTASALIDDATIAQIKELGGIAEIAISHPHYYTSMVEWSRAFGGAPIHIHEAERPWVMRPDPCVRFWKGEAQTLLGGLPLVRTGGHFEGYQVLHWPAGADGRGALMAGDQPQICMDPKQVSFMWSYPNYIPLNAPTIRHIMECLDRFEFDRIYGAFFIRGKGIIPSAARRSSAARPTAISGRSGADRRVGRRIVIPPAARRPGPRRRRRARAGGLSRPATRDRSGVRVSKHGADLGPARGLGQLADAIEDRGDEPGVRAGESGRLEAELERAGPVAHPDLQLDPVTAAGRAPSGGRDQPRRPLRQAGGLQQRLQPGDVLAGDRGLGDPRRRQAGLVAAQDQQLGPRCVEAAEPGIAG